jgi:tripartite-type tricarboxylate transporter receptor subunit TctC
LPNVPTLLEAGVKGVDIYSWQAFAAPKGLPKEVKAKLYDAIVAAFNEPATKAKLIEQGFEIVVSTPEQFEHFQAAELARWKQVIDTGNITSD